ncbi:MAG: S8 family serine peptidase [Betaproteobacteria bacterium]|nr:S8 family serine peptidase [Betaproteobacteria bacterium]
MPSPSRRVLTLAVAGACTALAPIAVHSAEATSDGTAGLSLTKAQERSISNAASHSRALAVHDQGITGRNIRINVIDTGVRATHTEFATGRVLVSASRDMTRSSPPAGSGATDGHGHGTFVASIAAGGANLQGFVGVAPDAIVISSQAMSASTGWSASGSTLLAAVRNGVSAGAFIHNMSLGGPAPVGESALREAVAAGTLSVVAAGNRGLANPDWPARYAKESWASNSIIAVGAVDANNTIASFSNRAGDTANWFVVALGVNVIGAGATSNTTLVQGSGTSMATPVVSGVAALIKSRWPTLRASQVGQIIFATATDLGARGIDPVYGHGLVNAERAMQPVGQTGTRTASGTWTFSTQGTLLATTPVWSAKVSSFAASGALDPIVFDSFQRDFTQDVSASVVTPRAAGFEGLAPFSDRQMQFAEKTLDPLGSRLMVAAETRTDLQRADGFETQSLFNYEHRFRSANAVLGAAWIQKFENGMQFGMGTGGMNGFFGLQGMDTVSTQMHAQGLQNPVLGMMPLAQSGGIGMDLSRGWNLKLGIASTQGGNAVAEQLGISGGIALKQTLAMAELNRAFDEGRTVVGVQVASLSERESLFGGQGYGLMSLSGMTGATQTVTLQAASRLSEDWVAGAQFTAGYLGSQTNRDASLVTGSTAMSLTGWGIGVTRFNALAQGDRFAITFSEPMAVRSGSLLFDVPVTDGSGNVQYRRETVSLAGSARERLYEAAWVLPLPKQMAALTVSGILRQHALGEASAPSELLGMLRYQQAF